MGDLLVSFPLLTKKQQDFAEKGDDSCGVVKRIIKKKKKGKLQARSIRSTLFAASNFLFVLESLYDKDCVLG